MSAQMNKWMKQKDWDPAASQTILLFFTFTVLIVCIDSDILSFNFLCVKVPLSTILLTRMKSVSKGKSQHAGSMG